MVIFVLCIIAETIKPIATAIPNTATKEPVKLNEKSRCSFMYPPIIGMNAPKPVNAQNVVKKVYISIFEDI